MNNVDFSVQLRTQAFFMRTVKTLIRLGGCPGWSESLLGAHAILLILSWGSSFFILTGPCFQWTSSLKISSWAMSTLFQVRASFSWLNLWLSSAPEYAEIRKIFSSCNTIIVESRFNLSHSMTKPTKWPVRPAKTQISLRICPVWSESLLCTSGGKRLGRCPGWSESLLGA